MKARTQHSAAMTWAAFYRSEGNYIRARQKIIDARWYRLCSIHRLFLP